MSRKTSRLRSCSEEDSNIDTELLLKYLQEDSDKLHTLKLNNISVDALIIENIVRSLATSKNIRHLSLSGLGLKVCAFVVVVVVVIVVVVAVVVVVVFALVVFWCLFLLLLFLLLLVLSRKTGIRKCLPAVWVSFYAALCFSLRKFFSF